LLSAWAGWLVDYQQPLYLIINSEAVAEAVSDLVYIGIDRVAGYFETTAIETLAETGYKPHSYQVTTADKVADHVLQGKMTVIDVRNRTEWDEGHIPGAQHLMLGYLLDKASEVINGQTIVVQCRTGSRSAIGASILQARGAKEVINLQGGIRDWAAAGLPVEK